MCRLRKVFTFFVVVFIVLIVLIINLPRIPWNFSDLTMQKTMVPE
jgi:hypothetical protein